MNQTEAALERIIANETDPIKGALARLLYSMYTQAATKDNWSYDPEHPNNPWHIEMTEAARLLDVPWTVQPED